MEDANTGIKIRVLPSEDGQPAKTFDAQVTGVPQTNLRWMADGRAFVYVVMRNGVSNL